MPRRRQPLRLSRAAFGASAAIAVLLPLAACGSNTATTSGHPSSTDHPAAQQAHVAQITPAEGQSTIAIGVGEEQVNNQLMKYLPSSMTATCTPGSNGAPYTVTIDSPNGWHVVLTHGSQQFTAENSQLGFRPAATFHTDQDEIDLANASNRRIAANHGENVSQFNGFGLTWDKPGPNEVEAEVSRRALPEYWPFGEDQGPAEFTLAAHVKC